MFQNEELAVKGFKKLVKAMLAYRLIKITRIVTFTLALTGAFMLSWSLQ